MSIKRKILCFVGWHQWTWKFRNIPFYAKCNHCGKPYSTYTVDKGEFEVDPDLEDHINKSMKEEEK